MKRVPKAQRHNQPVAKTVGQPARPEHYRPKAVTVIGTMACQVFCSHSTRTKYQVYSNVFSYASRITKVAVCNPVSRSAGKQKS
jgi:hypothetical protein